SRVLVVGATGQLGRVIVRKLVASGTPVRALARNAQTLAAVASGAEIATVDMRDVSRLTDACRGIDQIVATANNNMGKGENSASLLALRLKSSGKRRHIPVAAMRLLPPIVRPFNEVAARLMTLGLYSATCADAFPGWKASADRFGLTPRTVEEYVNNTAHELS